MKIIVTTLILFKFFQTSAQQSAEMQIRMLSNQIFQWEIEGKIDSLKNLFDSKLQIVNSRGDIQTKEQYLTLLNSGTFKHDSVGIEQTIVTIKNNTATVIGKGRFVMTVSGNKVDRHLSFMEVFAKDETGWKLLALYASPLPN